MSEFTSVDGNNNKNQYDGIKTAESSKSILSITSYRLTLKQCLQRTEFFHGRFQYLLIHSIALSLGKKLTQYPYKLL